MKLLAEKFQSYPEVIYLKHLKMLIIKGKQNRDSFLRKQHKEKDMNLLLYLDWSLNFIYNH